MIKKLTLLFLFSAAVAFGQATLTPNTSLQIPAYQQTNWQVPIIYDLNLLDGILGGTQTLAAGSTTPAVGSSPVFVTANTGTVTITNLTGGFFGQTVRLFCGAGDTFTSFVNSATMKLVTSPASCASMTSLALTNIGGVWTEATRAGLTANIYYQTVQNAIGTGQTQRPTIEFTGSAVASVVDDAGNSRTVITLSTGALIGCGNNTPVTVTNTVTGTNVLSCAIPANTLVAGSVIHVNFSGVESSASNYAPTLSINLGGGTSCTTATGTTTNANNQPWNIVATFSVITAGASGTGNWSCEYFSPAAGGGVSGPSGTVGAPTIAIDTTVSNTIQTKVTMSVANAGNSVTGQVLKAVVF